MMRRLVVLLLLFASTELYSAKYWEELSTDFKNRKVGEFPVVSLVDIDADGDLDMFIGNWDGYLAFYRNVGNNEKSQYVMENSGSSIQNSFQNVSTLNAAVPAWVDIDSDGDYDLFLGNIGGYVTFYENVGTPTQPKLKLVSKGDSKESSYFNICVGYNSYPTFVDIDGDNDQDLFIGERDGFINYYQNVGDAHKPVFQPVQNADSMDTSFNKIDVGECSAPSFIDIDNDGDFDMFIGNWEGYVFFYRNEGTKFEPFFKEINYAVSPETSFNHYISEGDCRFLVTSLKSEVFHFVFFQINGVISWFRTLPDFKNLVMGEQKMDVAVKMANYYFEKGKEEYLKSNPIEAKLFLLKGDKYTEIKKTKDLMVKVDEEIKGLVRKITLPMKDNFSRGNFSEAMDNLLSENFMKASVLFNQIKKSYNPNGILDKYIQMAEKYEGERKKIIRAESLDNDAISLYKQGKYQDALRRWEQASGLMPDDYTIVENIIMCKAAMDEMETSQVLNKMVQDVSNYIRKGDRENALKMYVKIMDIGPIPAKVKQDIARLKNDIMSFKEAAHEKEIEDIYQNGVKAFNGGQYEQAIESFRKVIFYKGAYKDTFDKLKQARKMFMEKEKLK